MTKIEWAQESWNPVTGCSPVSEGCENCYARRMAKRLAGRYGYPADEPFKPGVVHEDKMDQPARWKKPRRIFVCSMGDLFHPYVSCLDINKVWQQMYNYSRHTYMILTKRPENLWKWTRVKSILYPSLFCQIWPDNVWLGISTENQQRYEERWPLLARIPAVIRYISVEPMLGPITLIPPYPDWVICGAETGPGKREMQTTWALRLLEQCQEHRIPFFFKKDSSGGRRLLNKMWEEYPGTTNVQLIKRHA